MKIVYISAAIFLTVFILAVSGIAALLIMKGHAEIAYGLIGFGAIFCVSILVGVLTLKPVAKKPNSMALLAESLGMEYREREPSFAKKYGFLEKLAKGSRRFAFNIIRGDYQGHKTIMSHFHYQTGGKKKRSHYCSVLMVGLPRSVPELIVFKEGLFSKVVQFFGYDDIDFESEEFSRIFVVRSTDKKFAYDFCNPNMIEYFLENPEIQVEVEQNLLTLFFKERLTAEEFRTNLDRILEIRKLIPERVFD